MKKIFLAAAIGSISLFLIVYFFMPGTMFKLAQILERKAGGLEEKTIVVDSLNIHYLEGGTGDPLILIHGFGANKDNWTRIGKFLTLYFRVIAPDLPGFGESSKDSGDKYTIRDQTLFIKRFAKKMNLSSFHMGGSSMGGNIAGHYAFLFQEDLKSLFLISPGGVFSSQPSQMHEMLGRGEQNPLVARTAEEYDKLLAFVFVKIPFIPGPIKSYLTGLAIESRDLNTRIFQMIKDPEKNRSMESMLGHVNVKTFVLWGDKDRVLHKSGAKILGSILKNSQVTVLENVGHLPMIELPRKTADLYLAFLASN